MTRDDDYRIVSFQGFKEIQLQHERIGLPYEDDEQIKQYLFEFCSFLVHKGLAHMELPSYSHQLQPSFILKSSNLTERGKLFVRSALKRWMKARNKNGLKVLERAFDKFQE